MAETRCKKVCTSKSDLRTNDFSIVGSLPRDFELSNFDCYGKPIDTGAGSGKSQSKNNKRPPPPKPVIPSAAKRIDLYARALFPFSFLFFNVIYWSIYLWLSLDDIINCQLHSHGFFTDLMAYEKFYPKVNIGKYESQPYEMVTEEKIKLYYINWIIMIINFVFTWE